MAAGRIEAMGKSATGNSWAFALHPLSKEIMYVVSNRCEILCLDTAGLANGNQGFQDEAAYLGGPGKPPVAPGETDADIIWVFDMREELGVFPHNIASSSVLVVGDLRLRNHLQWAGLVSFEYPFTHGSMLGRA